MFDFGRVLVIVAVVAELMPILEDVLADFREGVDGVARREVSSSSGVSPNGSIPLPCANRVMRAHRITTAWK
jgi:hypothetical protein